MAIGPRVSLTSSNAGRPGPVTGAPIASGSLADIELPVGLLATVTDLGLAFEGDDLSFALAPSSDPLPAGLSMDADSVLFGTPSEAATRNLVIRASNTSGFADRAFVLLTFDLAFMASLGGLTDNPTFGPSALTGVPLSASAAVFNGPPPGPLSYQWQTLESGPIAGATTSTYTPDAMLLDGETLFCTISTGGYPATDSPGAVIRRTPPVAAMALPDEIFDIDTGFQSVDAAVDFTGDALTWSVSGAGATIDIDGLVSIDTGTARAGEVITVTAQNSGGSATSAFMVTIEDPEAAVFETTLVTTTQPVRGVTFTFDRPMPVGYAVNGDPIVIADEAFSIIDDSPASRTAPTLVGNGMMEFAGDGSDAITNNGQANGFDESWQQIIFKTPTQVIPYNPALNVAPSLAANGPVAVPAGTRKTFVKTVRNAENATGSIEEYVTLTVLPSEPATSKPFRPASVYADQTIFGESDINLACLEALAPPAGIPPVSVALNNLSPNASARQFSRWSGDLQRRIEDRTTRNLGATENYSADYAVARLYGCYLLHASTVSQADKMALAKKVIQIGLDVIGAQQANPNAFASGAGQWHGYHTCAYFAAFLLRDSTLLEAAQAMASNMQSMPRWVTENQLGSGRGWPSGNIGGSNWFGRTMDETDLGKPDWNGSGGRQGAEVPAVSGYKSVALPIGTQELLPILLLRDGPGGISGLDAFLQAEGGNGRYDTSNDRAAAIAVMERWQTWPDRERSWVAPYEMNAFWNAWMPSVYGKVTSIGGDTVVAWSGVPDATEEEVLTGAGTGSISYSYLGQVHATEPVTRYDLAWSLDNIQFVEDIDVGAFGTKAGLLRGTLHYAKMRVVSASGAGKWTRSGHKVRSQDSSNRGQITTTGSSAQAAPVFTTFPTLYRQKYPNQFEPLYTEAEANLEKTVLSLYCGVGYSTGYPAPTYSFDWKRNGVSIGAPDQNSYDIDPTNDAGQEITCTITSSNASGSATYTTSAVTVATAANYPPDIIFESDFDEDFFIDWGDEYASLNGVKANVSWRPNQGGADGVTFTSRGDVFGNKTGQNPRLEITLSRPLQPNTTYEVRFRFVADLDNWFGAGNNARFFIAPTASSVNNEWFRVYSPVASTPTEIEYDGASNGNFRFTTGATVLSGCKFILEHRTAQGGNTGGDVNLTYLRIRERP